MVCTTFKNNGSFLETMVIIAREELKKLIDTQAKYVLIDVREKEELDYGMIPTAQNLPLHAFEDAFSMTEEDF